VHVNEEYHILTINEQIMKYLLLHENLMKKYEILVHIMIKYVYFLVHLVKAHI